MAAVASKHCHFLRRSWPGAPTLVPVPVVRTAADGACQADVLGAEELLPQPRCSVGGGGVLAAGKAAPDGCCDAQVGRPAEGTLSEGEELPGGSQEVRGKGRAFRQVGGSWGRALTKVLWQGGHGQCSHCRKAMVTRVQKASPSGDRGFYGLFYGLGLES